MVAENFDLSILGISEGLKRTPRYGQVRNDLSESTADHVAQGVQLINISFRAFQLDSLLDYRKTVEMWSVHDLQESICGDTPVTKIYAGEDTNEAKQKRELAAWQQICRQCDDSLMAKYYYGLWLEFEAGESPEAKFTKAIDKMEAILHISFNVKSHSFPQIIPVYADQAVENFPALIPVWRAIKFKVREEFKKCGISWEDKDNLFL